MRAVEDARALARPALHEQVGEDNDVGDVGQRDHDDAARPQAREDASQHLLGLGQMLEHVAGKDRVERLVAEPCKVEVGEVALHTASRRLRACRGGARISWTPTTSRRRRA